MLVMFRMIYGARMWNNRQIRKFVLRFLLSQEKLFARERKIDEVKNNEVLRRKLSRQDQDRLRSRSAHFHETKMRKANEKINKCLRNSFMLFFPLHAMTKAKQDKKKSFSMPKENSFFIASLFLSTGFLFYF